MHQKAFQAQNSPPPPARPQTTCICEHLQLQRTVFSESLEIIVLYVGIYEILLLMPLS